MQVAALLQDISAATRPYPTAECIEQGYDGYPVNLYSIPKIGRMFGRLVCSRDVPQC